MKKTILLLCVLACHAAGAQTPGSQVTVRDDAKVGVIVTGTGNTINTTQIFGKSPEYAELKNALATLEADIQKKAAVCEKMAKDNLPAEYRDGCRSELIALNARRDSVQKIETRFREDVIRLAESFSKMELNSERLRLAKSLFEEGKIREADHVLNAREMKQEGDALLAKKEREQKALHETDSLLRVKADEFALKARLKATDYGDSLRYDSAVVYFEQSRKYGETVESLQSFSILLRKDNQTPLAIFYGERALQLPFTESEEAALTMNLGDFYSDVQKMTESEKMYLRSLNIYERLAKDNPAQFEPGLATTAMRLGVFYKNIQKMAEAEKMYLRSLDIIERFAKDNPPQFEPNLALTAMNLGDFYRMNYKMAEAEKMCVRSLEIYERLAKSNPAQFESGLAMTAMNLGVFYKNVQKPVEAEKMYLRSLDIYERLVKSNPAQFEPGLALTTMNLGVFYKNVQQPGEAEKMYLRSLDIYESLAKSNPAKFEPGLARIALNLGNFYATVKKMAETEKMYLRSLDIYERLAKATPAKFEPDLATLAMNLGAFYDEVQKPGEAEKMYLRSLDIYERLVKANPAQFEPSLAMTCTNLGKFYTDVQKMGDAETMYFRSLDIFERLAKVNPAQFEPNLAFTLNSFGYFKQVARQWEEAKKMYSRGLALRQKAVAGGQTYFWDELKNRVYTNMAALRDSFQLQKDYATVVAIQSERAACMDSLRNIHPTAAENAPQDYGWLSWYCLFARQCPEAQAAADRALALDPAQNWVRTKIGHSHLLRNDWPQAKTIYEEYLKNEADPAEAKKALAKEWDDLEAAGVSSPAVAMARKWAKE